MHWHLHTWRAHCLATPDKAVGAGDVQVTKTLACGDTGDGALAAPDTIAEAVRAALRAHPVHTGCLGQDV